MQKQRPVSLFRNSEDRVSCVATQVLMDPKPSLCESKRFVNIVSDNAGQHINRNQLLWFEII